MVEPSTNGTMVGMAVKKINFSIIIPTYNRKYLLQMAIESILKNNTDLAIIHIVVVDDGSTDQTESYLNSYIEKNLITYLRINNSERGFARNYGAKFSLKNLAPDYFIFFDADDLMIEGSIEKFCKFINKNDSETLLFSRFQILKPNESLGAISPFISAEENLRQRIIFSEPTIPLGCAVIPILFFKETVGFSENRVLSGSEDWLFLFEIILKFKAVPLDFVSTYYRQHDSNTNAAYFDRSLDLCLADVQAHLKDWKISEIEFSALKKQFLYNQIGVHNCDPHGQPFRHLGRLLLKYPFDIFTVRFLKYFLSVSKRRIIYLT